MDYGDVLSGTLALLRTIGSEHRPAVLANAFGPESMIMTDLIAKHDLDIEIVSIDTGRLPEETHALAHSVHQRYGPVVRMVTPHAAEITAWTSEHGQNGFYDAVERRHECCEIRKVKPLRRVLEGKNAWLTGLRKQQSKLREDLTEQTWDESYGLYKFNPMLEWTTDQVWAYIKDQRVPYNKLHDRGYASIGCAPCTRAISPGEDTRAGRWWWELDTAKECGIHFDPTVGAMVRTNADAGETSDDTVANDQTDLASREPLPAVKAADETHHEGKKMRVLILGGDGFCGWPTALHLSAQGHEVAIVDNLSRRKIDIELEVSSLTPIRHMGERLRAWKEVSGKDIAFHDIDVAVNYQRLLDLLEDWKPTALVHFAEQRAAPYSMKSSRHKRYTVDNNLNATNNVLAAVVESGLDIHVAHLGTMGVYGYGTAGMKIPEGYLQVKVQTDHGLVDQEILYPANPGSIYHLTKTQDQLLFAYYNKNDHVRVTDLHQGIVWGTQTDPDQARRAAHQPLRLRRRLWHGPEPVPDAGGDRPPADGARHRRPDPGVHPPAGHRQVHPARAGEPAGARRPGADHEPDDRDAPRPRSGPDDLRPHGCRGHERAEPAQRSRRERAVRRQRPLPAPRPQPRHPQRGPDGGGHRGHQEVRRPLRPDQDPLCLRVEQRVCRRPGHRSGPAVRVCVGLTRT